MITILCFLSLLAVDTVKVHRNPYTHTTDIELGCVVKPPNWSGHIMNWRDPKFDSCEVDSHYFPAVITEKCDTMWYYKERQVGFYFITDSISDVSCVRETTLVDSGVVDNGWWFSAPDGKTEIRKPAEEDTLWILDTPFLRSEMPDLKEMLREWRVEKCYKTALWKWPSVGIFDYEKEAIRDSCRCVYGKEKP